jgi:hypothetical protein
LPDGWIREEVPRQHHNMIGKKASDVYYISPMGKRVRYTGDLMDLHFGRKVVGGQLFSY